MSVSLGLETPGSHIVASPTMVLSESLVPIEEIDVGFRSELGITAHSRNPHQHLGCHQVQTQEIESFFSS